VISIITPSLNRAEFITTAIDSVIAQDYSQVEHIIMDGGSTDGSLEILAAYPHLRVISQKDRGMYDAINQGIQKSRGEIIGLLNSDDYYEHDVFSIIMDTFINYPEIKAICGSARTAKLTTTNKANSDIYPAIQPKDLLFYVILRAPIINAWFFRREILFRLGLFNLDYKIAADREFMIRFALNKVPYTVIDRILYVYQIHPGALTMSGKNDFEAPYMFENLDIAEKFLSGEDVDPTVNQYLKIWHSNITTEQTASALRRGQLNLAADYAMRGLKQNISWPFYMVKKIMKWFSYLLHRY
jgi:glycosyltransferase involved in cell wall biosynthesis